MRLVALLLLVLVASVSVAIGAPGIPTGVVVSTATRVGAEVQVPATWNPVAGATSYRWSGGATAIPLQQGTVTTTSATIVLPYSAPAAITAWGCIAAVDASGAGEGQCFPIPIAAATAPPPPPPPPTATTTHTLDYREPTTAANGTPLTNLASIRAYWRIGTGPETVVTYPASGPTGGATRTQSLTVTATSGTLIVTGAAVNTNGAEGARSAPVSKVIGAVPPATGTPTFTISPGGPP